MRTAISPGYPEQYALFKGHGHGIAVVTEVQRLCHADEKKLSMAATARFIWLCACVRYQPSRGLVCARKFVSFSFILGEGLRWGEGTFVTTAMLNNTSAHRDSFVRTKDTHFVIHMTTTK